MCGLFVGAFKRALCWIMHNSRKRKVKMAIAFLRRYPRSVGLVLAILSCGTLLALKMESNARTAECKKEATRWNAAFMLQEEEVPRNAIFFFGTADIPFIPPKQLCVIESAARHNPEKTVFVSWNSPTVKRSTALVSLLESYGNIQISFFNVTSWLKGTSLEPWLKKKLLETKSWFPVAHTSDIMRCASLYKYGGIYLDLDMMVLKNLGDLKNALGFEIIHWPIGTSLLVFDKAHPVMANCLDRVWTDYKPRKYTGIGPPMVDSIMKEWCGIPPEQYLEPGVCKNVTMLHSKLTYYPYKDLKVKLLYKDDATVADDFLEQMSESYTVHMWNANGALWPLRVNSNQPVARLARKNCPLISSQYDVLWTCDAHKFFSIFSLLDW